MNIDDVRTAVDQVSLQVAARPLNAAPLQLAWAQLVRTLALEPARATRPCPFCGNTGMSDATLCGFCWKKLTPV